MAGTKPKRTTASWFAMLCCLLLIAAACGGDSDGDADAETATEPTEAPADPTEAPESDPEPADPDPEPDPEPDAEPEPEPEPSDEPVELTASYRGVTADTIKVGLAVQDVNLFAAVGDITGAYEALAQYTNDNGGINGRMIELVAEEWLIVDAVAYEAACVALTEDAQVFSVLGFIVPGWGEVGCFTDRNETILMTTEQLLPEEVGLSSGRLLTTGPETTQLLFEAIDQLEGDVAGKRVAVYSGASQAFRLGEFADALSALGADVVDQIEQPDNGTDLIAAENAMDTIVQRWESQNVDIVFGLDGSTSAVVSGLERAGRTDIGIIWAGNLKATLEALGGDPTAFDMLLGVGPPLGDQIFLDGLYGSIECIDLLSELMGITMVPFEDPPEDGLALGIALRICANWDVFVTLATEAGPDLTEESFLQAGYDLGEFPMTGFPSGQLAPDRANIGNAEASIYVFGPEGEFVPR